MPAVEPPLADSKPAEATEAVEVPRTCGRFMRKATNDGIKGRRERYAFFAVFMTKLSKLVVMEHSEFSLHHCTQHAFTHIGSHSVVPLRI